MRSMIDTFLTERMSNISPDSSNFLHICHVVGHHLLDEINSGISVIGKNKEWVELFGTAARSARRR